MFVFDIQMAAHTDSHWGSPGELGAQTYPHVKPCYYVKFVVKFVVKCFP